jgi:hypothetical protein
MEINGIQDHKSIGGYTGLGWSLSEELGAIFRPCPFTKIDIRDIACGVSIAALGMSWL